jgi:hypothetical protein
VHHSTFVRSLEVTVRKHETVYQRARERETAFLPYPTATSLFDALSKRSPSDDGRWVLLRTIVLEYQRPGHHGLWLALSLRAFGPILRSIEADLRREGADRRQDLHVAFAEALASLRLDRQGGPTFPSLDLRRAVTRSLFPDRTTDEPVEEVELDEGAPECAGSPHVDPPQFVSCLLREIGDLLAKEPGGEDVARVLAGAETAAEQAERLSGPDVTYAGLEKRRHRTLVRVRREASRRAR